MSVDKEDLSETNQGIPPKPPFWKRQLVTTLYAAIPMPGIAVMFLSWQDNFALMRDRPILQLLLFCLAVALGFVLSKLVGVLIDHDPYYLKLKAEQEAEKAARRKR